MNLNNEPKISTPPLLFPLSKAAPPHTSMPQSRHGIVGAMLQNSRAQCVPPHRPISRPERHCQRIHSQPLPLAPKLAWLVPHDWQRDHLLDKITFKARSTRIFLPGHCWAKQLGFAQPWPGRKIRDPAVETVGKFEIHAWILEVPVHHERVWR